MPSFKNAFILTLGQVGVYGCSFLRNMILARALSKADFGLASIFAMTITMLELTSRMSLGVQVIQSPDGEREDFQNTSHSILAFVGIASAIVIAACAIPIANLINAPYAIWAFALLGIVPLLKGFEHLDNYRQRRNFNFTPSILSEFIPQVLVTIAAWPLAMWLKDYRVILWIIIAKTTTSIVLTHTFANRPYRWTWNKSYLRPIFKFSWPLLLNGLLLFLSQQADQLVIGSYLSLEKVAVYSASFSIAIIPFYIYGPIQGSLFLPILSKAQKDPNEFKKQYTRCLESSAIITAMLLSPIISSGEHIAQLLYGQKYSGAGNIIAILATTVALRCYRAASATAAISRADTLNQLYSNIIRSSSIVLAILAAITTSNLIIISTCALIGEIAATAYSIHRQKRILEMRFMQTALKPTAILTTILLLSLAPNLLTQRPPSSLSFLYSTTIVLFEIWLAKRLFPSAYHEIKNKLIDRFPQKKTSNQ